MGIAPAPAEVVKARDEAVLRALKLRPWTTESLVSVMPAETPALTAEQTSVALNSALTRLRIRGFIVHIAGVWRLA